MNNIYIIFIVSFIFITIALIAFHPKIVLDKDKKIDYAKIILFSIISGSILSIILSILLTKYEIVPKCTSCKKK